MERGNVLVIGNSGVGKSTLINAVLGEKKAVTGHGTTGVTLALDIFESEEVPFRLVDTIGFEPTFINELKTTNAIRKWSKAAAKEGHEDNKIDMIWFCIDGTSRKLFNKTISSLFKATRMWKSVPIIVVITKSFGEPDRVENIEMVKMAFNEQKKARNPEAIIPVVASPYTINETTIVPPDGIAELIDITNEKMPEAIKAGDKDVYEFKLKRRRGLAHSLVGISTAAGVTIGAVPIPFADAAILAPLELGLIGALSRIYNINKGENSKALINRIVEVGTVGKVAQATISALKAIPGINLGASVINAIVAGAFVAAIGQGAIYAFEKIYTGEKSMEDLDWITKVIEGQLSNQFLDKVTIAIEKIQDSGNTKDISKLISSLLTSLFLKDELPDEQI